MMVAVAIRDRVLALQATREEAGELIERIVLDEIADLVQPIEVQEPEPNYDTAPVMGYCSVCKRLVNLTEHGC